MSTKAAGKTNAAFEGVATASVGVKLSFSKESSVAMVYREVVTQRFQDERVIGDAMVRSWSGGPGPKMQIGDFAVTQLLVAGWGFVFGAKSSSTSVLLQFEAEAKIPDGANLGGLKGSFGIVKEQETSFRAYSPGGSRGVIIGYRGLLLTQKGFLMVRTVAEPRWEAFMFARQFATDGHLPAGAESLIEADLSAE